MSAATGFIYCVSSLGVTGVRQGEFKPEVYTFLDNVRSASTVPVAVGFGVSRYEQIATLQSHCDGVIVGSAIVKEIGKHHEALMAQETRASALQELGTFLQSLTGKSVHS